MSKILSVRISEEMYTKCIQGEKSRREIVTQALEMYFNIEEQGIIGTKVTDNVIRNMRQQIDHLKAMQDHMTGEIMYLRELHQNTMGRVLQIPENTTYDRDPIKDMETTPPDGLKHHQSGNIITKIGSVITNYKHRM